MDTGRITYNSGRVVTNLGIIENCNDPGIVESNMYSGFVGCLFGNAACSVNDGTVSFSETFTGGKAGSWCGGCKD